MIGVEEYLWQVELITTPNSASSPTSPTGTIFTSSSQNPGNVTLNTPGSYQIKLAVRDFCCGWSVPVYQTVVVEGPPAAAGTITGDNVLCAGELGVTYSISAVSGATSYTWTVPSGASVATGQGTTAITVNYAASPGAGNVSVTPINFCNVAGSASSLSVNIFANPSVTITGTSTICNGTSTSLTAGVSNGLAPYTYAWSGGPISGLSNQQTVSTTSLVGNQTYIIYITDNRGCEANASQLVTVLPTVVNGTLALGNETVCSGGDPAAITLSTVPSGGAGTFSYQWYFQNGIVTCPTGTSITGWTSIASANSSTYDPPSGLTGSRTYAVQVNATGTPDCGVATWSTGCRQVTVTPLPTVTSSSGAARCGPGTLTLSATASGGVINWYASAVSTTILGTGNAFITPPISLTTTYYAEAFQSGCPSATRTAVVATINTPINSGFITWTGSVNTDWHTVGNWDCGIPTLTDNVLIPGSLTNFPVISAADGNSYTIDLEGNATLNINGTWVLNVSQ